MDIDLDDSLQEITKLLALNIWTNTIIIKEMYGNSEMNSEVEFISQMIDSIISKLTFQQDMR